MKVIVDAIRDEVKALETFQISIRQGRSKAHTREEKVAQEVIEDVIRAIHKRVNSLYILALQEQVKESSK